MPNFLIYDIGTSNGRAMLGNVESGRVTLKTIHRFPNFSVPVLGTLYWDILCLWSGVLAGLQTYQRQFDGTIAGIGLDTWAVDFALLDERGMLLNNPVHNRDNRTDGVMERVFDIVSRDEIYSRTGIQFMQINTLYQLYSMVLADDPALRNGTTFLTIADLLNYWLTGTKAVEFTSATCTQFYDPNSGDWATSILKRLNIPTNILPPVVQPGTELGTLKTGNLDPDKYFSDVPVIAVATHDTGSAVAAVPAETDRFAYISSGTWSLMGAEVPAPVITAESLKYDFTNEGGVNGTYRLLKNILGMWLVQECQANWAAIGMEYTHEELIRMAAEAPPFGPLIDPYPNSPDFRTPGDMPARIRDFCRRTGQSQPSGEGGILRCIFESLALKYRQTLQQLEEVLGYDIEVIHIVGGGARNALLCQMTADTTSRPVIAGPDEATAMGNVLVQAMATGYVDSMAEGRDFVSRSSKLVRYEPVTSSKWGRAYARFIDIAQI
jgi:rhamnulokinase